MEKREEQMLITLSNRELKNINGGITAVVWFIIGFLASELNDRNSGNDFRAGFASASR